MTELTPEAKEMRKAYERDYYRRNPEKRREKQARYWNRKAAQAAAGGNFDIAEVRTTSKKEKELQDLVELRKQTEQRSDLGERVRKAKLKVIDTEISKLKSDSRH